MKKLIVASFIFLSISLFAQDKEQIKMFSTFKLGVSAGMNISALPGGSVMLEGKTNLTSDLNLTLSLGYSRINKKEGYSVQTYQHVVFTNYDKYETDTYNVDQINYDAFPVSIGLEYTILHNVFSPYALLEAGYNFTSFHQVQSGSAIGAGSYDTYDQLPSAYKKVVPSVSTDNTYRIAVGVGTTYKLSNVINLDLRYLYQLNHSLENTNLILIGISF